MASKTLRCQKCGKSFTKMRIVNTVRVIFTLFTGGILLLAFIIAIDQISDPMLPPMDFININSIIAALVVLVLVNLASFETIKQEKKKYPGMLCPDCQETVKDEKYQAHLAEEAENLKWTSELKAMTDADPTLRSVVKEWSLANGGAEPSRAVAAELIGAINFEKAGNFESAAKIYEQNKLWSLAGKVREKTRVQTVKHVTVDMNQLIEQIGTRGLAIPYRCHTCGASITIDKNSSVSGLKFCSYCGSAYNIEDMSKIVQEALG